LLLSSPGGCAGFFFEAFNARRKYFQQHTVLAADCPHISASWIAEVLEKYGEQHPLVRSMIFAEFMDSDSDATVIPLTLVERCLASPPEFADDGTVQAFCDFAAGGDENCLAIRRGNRVEVVASWHEPDTMIAVGEFIRLFREHDLDPAEIAADEGGLGIVVCDRLDEAGWPVRRVNNGSSPIKRDAYCNLAAENWYTARTEIERRRIILPNDRALIAQLTSRRGWPDSKGRLQVEPKSAMRSRGLGSPDRADAVIGAIAPATPTGCITEADLKGIRIGRPDFPVGDSLLFNDPPLRL
jgi:hypothetical protein